jgi:hypothetical protein
MWTLHEGYPEVIKTSWLDGNENLAKVQEEIGRLRTSLVNRSKDEFGSVKNQLRTMRKKLEGIRVGSLRTGPSREQKYQNFCQGKN